jgi:glycosyltransferase involved in cell wall biosynthesis
MKQQLYIYATSFNNADRIDQCLKSIAPLKPKKIIIVDNLSTDGMLEKLKAHKEITVVSQRCTMGRGRQIALDMILAEADDNDKVLYIDTDTIYKPPWIRLMKRRIRHNQYSLFGALSTVKTNRKLPWRKLTGGEDFERCARAKVQGCQILDIPKTKNVFVTPEAAVSNIYSDNDPGMGIHMDDRTKRYSRGKLSKIVRLAQFLITQQRAEAHKSFRSYYAICKHKSAFNKCAYFIAYHIANVMGVYSYDKKLCNPELVLGKLYSRSLAGHGAE